MSDVPQKPRVSEKRSTLAEMAAKAAQRSASTRPPSLPVDGTSRMPGADGLAPVSPRAMAHGAAGPAPNSLLSRVTGPEKPHSGSGLIDLQRVAQAPSLAPATRSITPPAFQADVRAAEPVVAEAKGNRPRRLLVAGLFTLLGLGVIYGVAAQQGIHSSHGAAASQPHADAPSAVVAAVEPKPAEPAPGATQPEPKVDPGTSNKGPDSPAAGTMAPAGPQAADARNPRPVARLNPRPVDRAPAAALPGSPPAALAKAMEPPKQAEPPSPAPPALPPTRAAADPPGLAGAIKRAAGPLEQAAPQTVITSAPTVRGDIPEVPAQGAIQGALGSQRGAARSCLADFDAPSRATVVFASSGNVQNVSVSGPAAGTKAESCIRAALSKAAVGPFRRASYSISTTISPP
jgi:hypothetical protein